MIPQYLINAYQGYYDHLENSDKEEKIKSLIRTHNPKERLAVYLVWNGIINHTEEIFTIATTESFE